MGQRCEGRDGLTDNVCCDQIDVRGGSIGSNDGDGHSYGVAARSRQNWRGTGRGAGVERRD